MGLFSKIWKGIKKTFKKIGKGIKKAFKSFGKFMNKIGIVGQIAMSFILPGIGNALLSTFGKAAGWLASGSLGAVGKAAGWVLGKAVEFGKFAVQGYKTVTGAVTDFIGTAGKFIGGKLGIGDLPNMTLGEAWGEYTSKLTDSFSKLGNAAKEFWDTDIKGAIPGGIAPSTVKNQELSKTPQTPIEEYTMELEGQMKSQIDSEKPYLDVFEKVVDDPMAPGYKPSVTSSKPDISSGIVDSTVSSETAKAGQSLLSRGFEFAKEAPKKALSYVGQSIVETPAKAGESYLMNMINPPEVFEPTPRGGYVSQFASQTYGATQQALQPIQPLSFGDYVNTYAMGGETQGTYLGTDFWGSYMQRSLAA